jgi:hypothetical protein
VDALWKSECAYIVEQLAAATASTLQWYRISNHHPPPDPLVQGVDDYFIYDTIEGLNSNLFAVSQSAEYSEQGADIHFTHLAS